MTQDRAPQDEQATVSEWWPESGSCTLGMDCPHEMAKKRRDDSVRRRVEEMRDDPKLNAEIAQWQADMKIVHAGGPAAKALADKWHRENREAGIRVIARMSQQIVERDQQLEVLRVERDGLVLLVAEAIGTTLKRPARLSPDFVERARRVVGSVSEVEGP